MAETDVAVDPARNLDADLDIIIDQPLLDGDDEGERNLGDYGGDMEVDKEPSKGEEEQLPEAYSLKRFEAVYLHGVDHMSTSDVKEYAAAYFPDEEPKFEWVDDSSIVLVFKSEEAAGKALDAFTSEGEFYDEVPADGALRVAKTHPGNGKYTLKVRGALLTDRKEKAAHLKSKYYLFHGDPREEEERRRERRSDRRSGRDSRGDYYRRPRRRSASPGRYSDENDDRYPPINKNWGSSSRIDRYVPGENYEKYEQFARRVGRRENNENYEYDSRRLSPRRDPSDRRDEGRSGGRGGDPADGDEEYNNPESRLSSRGASRGEGLSGRIGRRPRSPTLEEKAFRKVINPLDRHYDGPLPTESTLNESTRNEPTRSFGDVMNSSSEEPKKNPSDLASRIAPKDGGKGGRRRRAHHLDFD